MALANKLSASWRRWLDVLRSDDRQRLVEFLRDEYAKEAKDVLQFQAHTRRMTYPDFRARMLRIAEEEKTHVEWLRSKISALGGVVPPTIPKVKNGKNSWECLLIDIEEEKRDCASILERIYVLANKVNPEITEGLRRIHEEEKRHYEEFLSMLMKSDPQAFCTTEPDSQME
jgi:rubrerythrin